MRLFRRGGAPGTPSAWETSPPVCRLIISGGFAVIDRDQRRLHDRAHTLGFPDLHSYLVARCQDDASLPQLAGELDTTIDVTRRLIDEAGIHRPHGLLAAPVSAAAPSTSASPFGPPSSASPACTPIWLTA